MKTLLVVFAFAAGIVLLVVGIRSDSFADYLIGGLLLFFTVWECWHRWRRK